MGTGGRGPLNLAPERPAATTAMWRHLEGQHFFPSIFFQNKNSDKNKRCVCTDFQHSFVAKSKILKMNVHQMGIHRTLHPAVGNALAASPQA